MITELIELSLKNRFMVITLIFLMAVCGMYCAAMIPIDAVPDMTNVQVQVVTSSYGLSPLEVEKYVTNHVENVMGGIPHVAETRSISRFGVSLVTVVFDEGTDILVARQLVNERLDEAKERIESRHGVPQMGVMATALGEVLQFEVRGGAYTPMQLRSILDWQIAPRMREVPGIIEINSHGGYYKSFEVQIDPTRMLTHAVGLEEIIAALERNNGSAGGGYIVHEGEQRFIRGQALLRSEQDIEQVVIRRRGEDAPVLIDDVADVNVAPLTRQGAATRDGRGEVVTGMVMMGIGQNSRTVVEAAKQRIAEIQTTLPPGIRIDIIYDRAELIGRTLHTVVTNLVEGGVLVIVVLLLLLGSVRAGVIVAMAIPLSMLFATNVMYATGITASLMSLGAIDFGLIVDSSVIMIENCIRRIAHPYEGKSHWQVIRDAALEVRKPTMFGELIIAIVYLPILTLQGTEGKLFRPMALTVLFALAGSLVLSLTLMPVLAFLGLPKSMHEKEVWLLRVVKWFYRPMIERVIKHPVAAVAVAVATVAVSIPVAIHLGGEFMPRLDEGDVLVEMERLPSSTLEDSTAVSTHVETLLKELPEVRTVFCKTGRPEIANDIMGVQQTDVWVMLHPPEKWPAAKSRDELVDEMSRRLNEQIPGATFSFTQPIEMRVDELVAGVKADVAVIVYGPDIPTLTELTQQIENVLQTIPGAADVKVSTLANTPGLTIKARPEMLAQHGIAGADVLKTVAAIGGYEAGRIYEGRAYYPIIVRFPADWREDQKLLAQIPVQMQGGTPLPLGEVADISLDETPPGIEHESKRRRAFVQCNIRGRDIASFVVAAQERVAKEVTLPAGYEVDWGGDFENLQSAKKRLAIITPIVLLVIWLLLYTSFHSVRLALLVFLAVPVAASGGVFALALRGMPFSISAGVGFIALFGVAVLNGLVWVSGAEHCRATGMPLREAAHETALARIRPVLMTALVASLGFLPMAISHTSGAEIQRPLATVVIGGLVTSTLLTAFFVPSIYPWFAPTSTGDPSDPE